jgi:hypothetical protein
MYFACRRDWIFEYFRTWFRLQSVEPADVKMNNGVQISSSVLTTQGLAEDVADTKSGIVNSWHEKIFRFWRWLVRWSLCRPGTFVLTGCQCRNFKSLKTVEVKLSLQIRSRQIPHFNIRYWLFECQSFSKSYSFCGRKCWHFHVAIHILFLW